MSTKASETLTVTEPTTNSTMPTLNLNIRGIKTPPVLLKFLETIIASICLYIGFSTQMDEENYSFRGSMGLQIVCIIVFLITTSLLLISSLVSSMSANMIPKTIFEFLYHLSASVLYLIFSLLFTVTISKNDSSDSGYTEGITLAVLCILNTALYCISTFYSYRSYRSS